jgi:hypothetical protein
LSTTSWLRQEVSRPLATIALAVAQAIVAIKKRAVINRRRTHRYSEGLNVISTLN